MSLGTYGAVPCVINKVGVEAAVEMCRITTRAGHSEGELMERWGAWLDQPQ